MAELHVTIGIATSPIARLAYLAGLLKPRHETACRSILETEAQAIIRDLRDEAIAVAQSAEGALSAAKLEELALGAYYAGEAETSMARAPRPDPKRTTEPGKIEKGLR